jgi:SAM-dependent methyltransferase
MDGSAEAAYEAIAPVYDEFTAHHDHELWLGELLPRLERRGLRQGRLLDVGCGTGKSFLPMLARGWAVTACDLSPSMLALAREKLDSQAAATLHVADMRALPRYGQFELVWALDDAVNYLLDREELAAALRGMRRNMAPRGFLVFDLNTLRSYRSFFAETAFIERDGLRLTWEGQTDPAVAPGSIAEARFKAGGVNGVRVAAHMHRQRHFPRAEVLAACADVGLTVIETFGHGDDASFEQPLDEAQHAKAVYLAQPEPN